MKKIALFILGFVCMASLWAQTGPSIVRGYVVDAINGGRLSGASVKVIGSTKGAVANEEGFFELYAQPGKLQLQVSYLGYRDTTLNVDLAADRVSNVRVFLSSSAPQLTNVVISGYLQGQAKALNQQRNADKKEA